MRKSGKVSLSITTAMALALSGCGSSTPDDSYQAVCVDQKTNKRIDDSQCGGDSNSGFNNGFLWYYLAMNRSYPPVGGAVTGGSYTAPRSGNYVRGGVGRTGGKVTSDSIAKASSAKGSSTFVGGAKGSAGSISRGGFGGGAKGGSSGG